MEQLIVLVVVGVLAFLKWYVENAGKGASDETRPPAQREPESESRSQRPRTGPAPLSESEEERMRRFMEALGLPQGSVPPPVRKPVANPPISTATPIPEKPYSQAPTVQRPHPRQLGRPLGPQARPIPTAGPAPRPHLAPPLETGGPLPSIPKTASVGETAPSMEVTAIPQMTFAEPMQAVQSAATEVNAQAKLPQERAPQEQSPKSVQSTLRELLRDPASQRSAMLLREILGAPKGLQFAENPSTFTPL